MCVYIASPAIRAPPVWQASEGGRASPPPPYRQWLQGGSVFSFFGLINYWLSVVRKYLLADHHVCALATSCFG